MFPCSSTKERPAAAVMHGLIPTEIFLVQGDTTPSRGRGPDGKYVGSLEKHYKEASLLLSNLCLTGFVCRKLADELPSYLSRSSFAVAIAILGTTTWFRL